jgi:lysophospholipase L1-like esterase
MISIKEALVKKQFLRIAVRIQRGQTKPRLAQLVMVGIVFGLFFSGAIQAQQATQPAFALKAGDRVVFYGDSITAQHLYTRFVEDFVITRYPQIRIDFYNAGVGGDTVSGGYSGDMQTRLTRDVLPLHPTVVTIMLGMNDGRYITEFEKNFQTYQTGYRTLVDDLKTDLPGIRLTLIRPSPYDEIAHPPDIAGYNGVLLRYGDFVSQFGEKQGFPVVNFNQPMTDALRAGMKIDSSMAGSLLPDRIHPSPAAHWIMAVALVHGWNISPIVSSVALDAARTEITSQQNTIVSEMNGTANGLRWAQLDRALPLPLELNDSMTQFLLQVSDIASLDRQMLYVTGLLAASYSLKIDDHEIASFSRQELASGINLALYQTPMEQQAKSIDWTADDRSKLNGTRFDLLFDGNTISGEAGAVQVLDALDAKEMNKEYKNAQPKPHTFQLTAE